MFSSSVKSNSATPWTIYSLSSSSVHGIFQARILGCVAISSCKGIFSSQRSNSHLLCLLHCRWILYGRALWEASGMQHCLLKNNSWLGWNLNPHLSDSKSHYRYAEKYVKNKKYQGQANSENTRTQNHTTTKEMHSRITS